LYCCVVCFADPDAKLPVHRSGILPHTDIKHTRYLLLLGTSDLATELCCSTERSITSRCVILRMLVRPHVNVWQSSLP
jgi:hypothetical protein